MRQSDDIIEDYQFVVTEGLLELHEMLEQRLANPPKGENSLKQWNKDVKNLKSEIDNYGETNRQIEE